MLHLRSEDDELTMDLSRHKPLLHWQKNLMHCAQLRPYNLESNRDAWLLVNGSRLATHDDVQCSEDESNEKASPNFVHGVD